MTTLEKIYDIIEKVQQIKDEHGLAKIPSITYKMREAGEDMIYFSKGTWNNTEKYLVPSPISSQKEYKDFFAQKGEGTKILSKYALCIYEDRNEFEERSKVDGKLVKKSLI